MDLLEVFEDRNIERRTGRNRFIDRLLEGRKTLVAEHLHEIPSVPVFPTVLVAKILKTRPILFHVKKAQLLCHALIISHIPGGCHRPGHKNCARRTNWAVP